MLPKEMWTCIDVKKKEKKKKARARQDKVNDKIKRTHKSRAELS